MNLRVKANPRHVSGWLLIASGVCLLWLWQNFHETFGGSINFGFAALDTIMVPFVVGVVCVIAGALLARGGWSTAVFHVPVRYVVGVVVLGAAATTAHPTDRLRRADTWVAFRMLRTSLDAIAKEVPHGLTSMECSLQLGDQQQEVSPDPGCKRIYETRVTQRSPTEDSLYSAMADAQARGFFDIEVRPTHLALVRIVPAPGLRNGFLKLHEPNNPATLPQQLFLRQLADLYPLGDGWFHFVTR